jgi:hypothetical protein
LASSASDKEDASGAACSSKRFRIGESATKALISKTPIRQILASGTAIENLGGMSPGRGDTAIQGKQISLAVDRAPLLRSLRELIAQRPLAVSGRLFRTSSNQIAPLSPMRGSDLNKVGNHLRRQLPRNALPRVRQFHGPLRACLPRALPAERLGLKPAAMTSKPCQ